MPQNRRAKRYLERASFCRPLNQVTSNRVFKIGKNSIVFKHTTLKETGFVHRESSIIVQGLKSLGSDRINANTIETIRNWLDPRLSRKVLCDTKITTGWIHAAIVKICQGVD